jgi:hypothetical protein
MQLMTPTPMKALRQARKASPSSERRTPEVTAIKPDLYRQEQDTENDGSNAISVFDDSVTENRHAEKLQIRSRILTDVSRMRLFKSH